MTLFVDTSVWSLAFRRDIASAAPEVSALRHAIEGGEAIVTTGLVLQDLLQGFAGPRARKNIINRFTALPLLTPVRQDHIDAAELRNRCRRAGVQIGTIRCPARAIVRPPQPHPTDHGQRLRSRGPTLHAAGVDADSLTRILHRDAG